MSLSSIDVDCNALWLSLTVIAIESVTAIAIECVIAIAIELDCDRACD